MGDSVGSSWKDGLSIDESKTSALILSLVSFVILAIYSYVKNGDITENLMSIINIFASLIAGFNITNKIVSVMPKNNIKDDLKNEDNNKYI